MSYSTAYLRLVRTDVLEWIDHARDPRRRDVLEVCLTLLDEKIRLEERTEANTYHPERAIRPGDRLDGTSAPFVPSWLKAKGL